MRFLSGILCAIAMAVGVYAVSSSRNATLQAQGFDRTETVKCSSDDGRIQRCFADVAGGVQMIRQISDSPCIFTRTWGFDARGIWVDRGCRAEFRIGTRPWVGWGQTYTLYCASDDRRRQFCSTNTRGGVSLVRQRSDSPCIYDRTWGYNRRGIWVDRGCRADFQLGGDTWSPEAGGTRVLYCASDDERLNRCAIDTRGEVRLIRQRSDADCIFGRTWGFGRGEIWVDRGCRADFEVGR